MNDLDLLREMLPFLIPLFLIQLSLMVYALVDLARRDVVKGGRKLPWAVVIIFFGVIGPLFYLLVGREQY
jgi:hypothetical protein